MRKEQKTERKEIHVTFQTEPRLLVDSAFSSGLLVCASRKMGARCALH